jgi:hypothetical protein
MSPSSFGSQAMDSKAAAVPWKGGKYGKLLLSTSCAVKSIVPQPFRRYFSAPQFATKKLNRYRLSFFGCISLALETACQVKKKKCGSLSNETRTSFLNSVLD